MNGDEPAPAGLEAAAEDSLVAAARSGDAAAFEELVRRHMRQVFAIALRVVRHREDAEDLVQESFVAALRNLGTFEPGRPFAPWLARIVLNRALNLRKSRALRTTGPLPADAVSAGPSPLEAAERSELRTQLRRALDTLPEPRRRMLELFEIDGFSSREIAGIMDVPEGTVRWHVHQARSALRDVLSPYRKTAT
jgi:RNA polymerase sigma-70 factor, ECF subfamily